jgi:hypothetical protein
VSGTVARRLSEPLGELVPALLCADVLGLELGAPPVGVWARAVLLIKAAASPKATILIGVILFTESTVAEERPSLAQVPADANQPRSIPVQALR